MSFLLNFVHDTAYVNEGKNIVFKNITISAVSTSSNDAKNTDGWDIFRSDNVTIADSNITNGDDCVSFKPSMSYVPGGTMPVLTIGVV